MSGFPKEACGRCGVGHVNGNCPRAPKEVAVVYPEFEVHILNERGIESAKTIAEVFNNALGVLSTHCPEGREWSLVKTKMEEACFFCKKAMAKDPQNQKGA